MRFEYTAGMFTGLLLGVAGVYIWQARMRSDVPPKTYSRSADAGLESFMFTDTTLADIYYLPWIQKVLSNPKSATIYLRSTNGLIQYGEFRFGPDSSPIDAEDTLALSRTLRAMNAYKIGLGVPCSFDPKFLIRLEADGHHLDFLVCLSCRLVDWYADGKAVKESIAPRVGLSDLGFRVLRRIFDKLYPDRLGHGETSMQEPRANKASHRMPDPPPVPAVMTATTSTHSRSLAPGQA